MEKDEFIRHPIELRLNKGVSARVNELCDAAKGLSAEQLDHLIAIAKALGEKT